MKAYYARPISIDNTPQFDRDVALIRSLGFEVSPTPEEKVSRVEISFPCPVSFPDGWERALDGLIGMVCEQYQRENPDQVMWPAGCGSKMLSNPMAMGDDEKLEFDDSVYAIDCAAREDYYGDNPHNPRREELRTAARTERQARKAARSQS